MSRCALISSFYNGRFSTLISYILCFGLLIYTTSDVVYAMEPDTPDIASVKDNIEYWQLQSKTYAEAKSALYKPEASWSQDERLSVEDLKSIDEFSSEKIDAALKDIRKNISSSQAELAKFIPKFSDSLGKRSGDSSLNPASKRS